MKLSSSLAILLSASSCSLLGLGEDVVTQKISKKVERNIEHDIDSELHRQIERKLDGDIVYIQRNVNLLKAEIKRLDKAIAELEAKVKINTLGRRADKRRRQRRGGFLR